MLTDITILTVNNEEESFDMYFTDTEKAIEFVYNNFYHDDIKKVTNDYFEGNKNTYSIDIHAVNQVRI
jgi:hypothetical protein